MLTSAGKVFFLYGMHFISRLYARNVLKLGTDKPPQATNTDDNPTLETSTTSCLRDGHRDETAQLNFAKYPRLPTD
jgi:hypothetical protein